MTTSDAPAHAVRITLANLPMPPSPDDAVRMAVEAVAEAGAAGAAVVCFPECFVPGYRGLGHAPPQPDPAFLADAGARVAAAAASHGVAVVLGTERVTDAGLHATARVIGADGRTLGWQDKVQIDPSEEGTYAPGAERHLFRAGPLAFGVVICHEGWRYPETVRWAARRGAHVVFHPHYHPAEPGGHRPTTFAEAAGTFHEKALLCRAAENTVYVASVNHASPGSATTSAVIRPDGTVLAWQPYGLTGLLVADLDLREATGLLARRYRPVD